MPNPDARLFATLIEPHLDALFRAAYRLARNRADAEDLVQESCVRAFERNALPPSLVVRRAAQLALATASTE